MMQTNHPGKQFTTPKKLKATSSSNTKSTCPRPIAQFLLKPHSVILSMTAASGYAQQILAGTANIDSLPINEYSKALLTNLKTKVPTNDNPAHPLDPRALLQGFKLWPEWMSTSPSGTQLGIYKPLAKHFPLPKDKTNTEPVMEPPDPLQCRSNILKLIILMMDLALTHTHTYD